MNTAAALHSSSFTALASSSPFLPNLLPSSISKIRRKIISINSSSPFYSKFSLNSSRRLVLAAAAARDTNSNPSKKNEDEEIVEEEEDLPWIQEKALDLVEFTGSVTHPLPGPRVGQSSFPWILVVPLAYVGVSFVLAFVKTVQKFRSPKEKRRKLVTSPSQSQFQSLKFIIIIIIIVDIAICGAIVFIYSIILRVMTIIDGIQEA